MFIIILKTKIKVKKIGIFRSFQLRGHNKGMKHRTIYLALFLIFTVPNVEAAKKSEIIRFCKKTKSYEKCLEEFEGIDSSKSIINSDKPIEIQVIPWRS